MKFISNFLQIIFPDRCFGCKIRGVILCDSCILKIEKAREQEYDFILSLFSYENKIVRNIIHSFKYKNNKRVANALAPYLAEIIKEFLGEEKLFLGKQKIIFVPVPITSKRRKQRGYNQSEILANKILKEFKTEDCFVDDNLVLKIKETLPQAQIKKRSLRLKSQKDNFKVLKNKYSHKEIIFIVDDVVTTGATLLAVRSALKKSGFKKIYAVTIAH